MHPPVCIVEQDQGGAERFLEFHDVDRSLRCDGRQSVLEGEREQVMDYVEGGEVDIVYVCEGKVGGYPDWIWRSGGERLEEHEVGELVDYGEDRGVD